MNLCPECLSENVATEGDESTCNNCSAYWTGDPKYTCPECSEEIEDTSECVDGLRCAACYEKGLE